MNQRCWQVNSNIELVGFIKTFPIISSYKETAARLSRLIKLKPRPPVTEAAEWVEYLLAQGSLAHLRPRELDLPFYQLYMLDVLLAALVFLIAVFIIVRYVIRIVASCIFGSWKKEKTQ